ncbi:MAG: VTT domain-containing protein [Burkholderiales bacterium]
MDVLLTLLDFVLHLDQYVAAFWMQYGFWLYILVFVIVFSETGLVITPWLPGDSLLFVLGALAAADGPHLGVLLFLLWLAAVLGNTSNYWIGRAIGPRAFHYEGSRFFSRETLLKTHAFYEKHGALVITVSRFLPLIRTFAPFVAGVGAMPHGKFQCYSIAGGGLWVLVFVLAGYFFGQIPLVKENLPLVIVGVILISFLPLVVDFVVSAWRKRTG